MQIENLEKLIEEINNLKHAYSLLLNISYYLNPYDHKINGKDCNGLCRKIHEFLNDFDDSE